MLGMELDRIGAEPERALGLQLDVVGAELKLGTIYPLADCEQRRAVVAGDAHGLTRRKPQLLQIIAGFLRCRLELSPERARDDPLLPAGGQRHDHAVALA